MGAASATKTSKKASSKTTDGSSKTAGDVDGVAAVFYYQFQNKLASKFKVEKSEGKEEYYLYCAETGVKKSFWHDIPIQEQTNSKYEFSFVCEIPSSRLAKLEVEKTVKGNPILQDVKTHPVHKNKVPRFYYIFPTFNYGIIPQTYDSPKPHPEADNLCVLAGLTQGDDDPIDVLELSGVPCCVGDIFNVSVFGCFPLVDQGELDYKILAIRSDHELAVVFY